MNTEALAELLAAHADYFDCWNQCRNSGLPAIEDSTPLEAESAHRAHIAAVIWDEGYKAGREVGYEEGHHRGYRAVDQPANPYRADV